MARDILKEDEVRALDRVSGEGVSDRNSMVPASYAEKAMSSLMSLHQDLVEEKERRIDLYRRLMEREQSLAEMRAYVKLLENELARTGFDAAAVALDPMRAPTASAAAASAPRPAAPAPAAPATAAPAAAAPAAAAPATAAPATAAPATAAPATAAPATAAPATAAPATAAPATAAVAGPGPVVAWTPITRQRDA